MAIKNKTISIKELIRFMWTYIKEYKKLFFIVIIFSIITSFITAVTPYLFGKIIDIFLTKKLFYGLGIFGVIVIWTVLTFIKVVLQRVMDFQSSSLEVKVEKSMVSHLFKSILKLPVKYHYDQKPGTTYKVLDRISNAVNNVLDVFLYSFFPNIITIIIALLLMMSINVYLSLLNLIVILIFFVFASKYKMEEILAYRAKVNKSYNKIFGNIGDSLANIFSVKINTSEKHERAQLNKNYSHAISNFVKQMKLFTKVTFVQSLVTNMGVILTVIIGAILLNAQEISPGEFVIFFAYLSMIYTPLWFMSNQYRNIKRYLIDFKDAIDMLNQKPESDLKDAIDMNLEGGLEFKDVSFSYPERDEGLLNKVSFKINKGETLAIFGETGSGKTTVYNLILDLYAQDSGAILFDGVDTKKITSKSIREQIAVVPQDPILFNDSIFMNIKYSNSYASRKQAIKAAKISGAHDFIMKLPKKYETKVGERGVKLSGGQVQRISIARAVLRNPKILILDEATSSLDQKTKFTVLGALRDLIKGRTTIIITHDFSAITTSADNIIVLSNGKIVQQGKHEQLVKKKGIYSELYKTQQEHML